MNAPRELTIKMSPSPLPEVDSALDLSRRSPVTENSFAAFIGRARDSRPFPVKPFGGIQMDRVKPRSLADSAPPKSRSTTGRTPVASGDEEQFEQNGDSTRAERAAAAQRQNSDDTSNVPPMDLSEPPLRYGARSKATAVSKDVASATGETPRGTIAEDVRRAAGTTPLRKDEPISLGQEVEKDPNDPRSEITTKVTLESELAGTENGSASTRHDSIGGQSAQGSSLPSEPLPMTSNLENQTAPIPCVGDATLSKSSAVVGEEARGKNPGDGTVVAQMENVMKTMVKENKSAVKVEQKLPQASLAGIETMDPDFSENDNARDTSAVKDAPSATAWLPLAMDDRFQGWSTNLELAPVTKPVLTSEQLFFQISKQAVALKHFNADSMAVVLKPDSETAIFLHLQLQNGQVEVHARFERGDYQALQAGWAQLRESLASQGIRLSPLHNSLSNDSTIAGQTSGNVGSGKRERYSDPQTPDQADSMSWGVARPRTEVGRRSISQSPVGQKRQWEHWA